MDRLKKEVMAIRLQKYEGVTKMFNEDYHILLVLHGNLRIQIYDENYFLNENDVILLIPGNGVCVWGSASHLVLDVALSAAFVRDGIPVDDGRLICNSSLDQQHDYQPLRKLLAKIAVVSFEPTDTSGLFLDALSSMLLYYLRVNHYESHLFIPENRRDLKYKDRVNDLLMYIKKHYREELRLEEMAENLHLSASYLSRFFKSTFHENFMTYLKNYRLDHAMNDLQYTDMTVTEIAVRHGFPSANAYIQTFRDVYGETPGSWRKTQQKVAEAGGASLTSAMVLPGVDTGAAVKALMAMAEDLPVADIFSKLELPGHQHLVIPADDNGQHVVPVWKNGINLASARNIMSVDILDGIKKIQAEIGFKYGRVSFLFLFKFIKETETRRQYNFYPFTRMIDSLLQNGMIPYLDLSFGHPVLNMNGGVIVIDSEEYLDILEQLVIYCANVFGTGEMERWIYDIGMTADFNNQAMEDPDVFARRFVKSKRIIKKHVPGAVVGGFNGISAFMTEITAEIVAKVLELGEVPDFVSISIFPYTMDVASKKYIYSTDDSYAIHTIQKLKKQLGKRTEKLHYHLPIYVSAIGTTVMHRDYINDTCYQSVFLVKNMIDLVGEVDVLCYYQMSDFNFSYDEDHLLLSGRNGLLSQFGIPKPGFLALRLMSVMPGYMLTKGPGYLVTRGQNDTYYILLCNYVRVSDHYCMHVGEPMEPREAYTIYNTAETLSIWITLDHVRDGGYRIISYHLNRDNGSLFDEWERTGFWKNPDSRELGYLRQAMHPKRSGSNRSSTNGQLNFQMHLMPFEVVLIEATRNEARVSFE